MEVRVTDAVCVTQRSVVWLSVCRMQVTGVS